MAIHLTQDSAADRSLETDSLALLIGMLIHDDQLPVERAFMAPFRLAERLGVARLDAAELATFDHGRLVEAFAKVPALHRFPAVKADRVRALCAMVADGWAGDPGRLWSTASNGPELVARLKALPGFDLRKAQIFVALLGKRLGLRLAGWQEASGRYGAENVYLSVADISDDTSLAKVRLHRKRLTAEAASERW